MKNTKLTNFLYFFIAIFTFVFASSTVQASNPKTDNKKAILVTGASSGIGLEITKHLSENGFYVYAGARKKKDLERLDKMRNVSSVRLDVTKQEEIDAAVKWVESQDRGLYGLVNNAGVAIVAPLIEAKEKDLEFLFDVNVFGPYRVSKAFAPLIIKSKGRITTISSISGVLSGTLFGPYSMSKHAIEAYGDSLSLELQRFGVKVSLVEPGNYNSKIGRSMVKRMKTGEFSLENTAYKNEYERMISIFDSDNIGKSPLEVAQTVMHFMDDEKPKQRYMVVPNQRQARITIKKAMTELMQLNQDHQYSYSKEQLIKMMEEVSKELSEK